jgi:hypothetical protein
MDKLPPAAQRRARADIERAVAAEFPAHAWQVTVLPFSATRRIGVAEAEAVIGDWLGAVVEAAPAQPPARIADARHKEKAPRTRGVSRGPKRPRQG